MDYDPSQNHFYPQQQQLDYQQQQQQQQQLDYQQQQQQQDYQQQQQGYQQQQQYQQQLQQSQPYDPSQTQSYEYDPSTQSYFYPTSQSYPQPYQNPTNPTSQSYPQHPQYPQQEQQQHQQQQYPSYYPPDYGVPGVYQGALQNDPNSAQLAAGNVGVPQEAPQIAADGFGAVGQPQQNAYYPPEQPQQQQQQQRQRQLPQQATGYDVPPGLNPAAAAAVAALSQLTQFAGKMDAAERAMAERQWQARNGGFGQMVGMHPHSQLHPPGNFGPPIGRPPYRGGGRRGGGGQFRGGRSNFGHQRPRPVGGAPPSRARGRMGRGGGRRFPQRAPASASLPHLESSSDLEPSSSPSPAPEQKRRAPQVAWCDLCRVDCNTQEVLEQHINGKRHKKNMEKFEKFQKYGKIQSESLPKLAEQLENGQGGEENKDFAPESLPDASATENLPDASAPENLPKSSSAENLPSATAADENMGVEQQIQIGEQSEIPKLDEPTDTPARKPWAHRFEDRRRAPKWKQMKFGRGGKRPRYSEVVSSSQTPREEPKYCALCNVTCDTQAVFECHLSGKKHMTLVKETQGQHDSYVHQGVHAPHPSLAHQIDLNPQGENQPPNGQTQQAVTESQDQQDPGLQGQINTAEPKVPEAVVVETRDTGVVVMEIEGRGTTLENASMGAESELITAEDVSAPNFGVSSTNVIMPGLDVKVDEGSKNTE